MASFVKQLMACYSVGDHTRRATRSLCGPPPPRDALEKPADALYVTEFSHLTLIGRYHATTLLYNIRSSVEASAGHWLVGPSQHTS